MAKRQAATLVGVALTMAVGVSFVGTSAPSEELTLVARWEMNEAAGAEVMADSGPHGLDGAIGNEIDVGGGWFSWSYVDWYNHPATVERIVLVDHSPVLDPGLGSFSIEIRYRSNLNYGNIVQKGQNGSPTGAWKLEHPWGLPGCAFKDENGVLKAVLGKTETVDGEWHVVMCEFDRDFGDFGRLRVFVDGKVDQVNVLNEPLGRIFNDQPLAMGGKFNCNQDTIYCDYFWGEIDYVEIRSDAAAATTTTTTSTTTTTTTTTTTVPGATTTTVPGATTTTVASGSPGGAGGIYDGATGGAPARRGGGGSLEQP